MTGSAAMDLGFAPIRPLCTAAPGHLGSLLVLFPPAGCEGNGAAAFADT